MKARVQSFEIPTWAEGPIGVARVLWQDVNRLDILQRAGGMAYTMLFSIVPSLAATFALISAFQPVADPNAQWFDKFRAFVLNNLAPDTGAQVVNYLQTFLANLDTAKIGLTGVIGLVVTLILLLHNIEGALNEIWQVRHSRSLFKRFIFFWTFCTLGAFMLSLVVGVLSRFDLTNLLPWIGGQMDGGLSSRLVTFAATFLFFAFLYKITPNCQVKFKPTIVGALAATVMIRIASEGFTFYAANNQTYMNVYGALAALPFFLLWLYIGWVVTLLGSCIAWRMQIGFGDANTWDKSAPVAKTTLDAERELQTRAVMPLLCIYAVGRAFAGNRREGVSAKAIAKSFNLPLEWTLEGLRAAASLGYVVMSSDRTTWSATDPDPDEASARYFLTTNPASLSLKEILANLTDKTVQLAWVRDILRLTIKPDAANLTLADLMPASPGASAPSRQPRSDIPERSGADSRT